MKKKSRIRDILMLITLGLAYFFSNFHRQSLGIIAHSITADFDLTSLQLSNLGSALFYTYAFMQVPTGLLTDRFSPRKLVIFSCILTAASSVMFSMGTQYGHLLVARALTGIGTAMIYVPSLSILRRAFGEERLGGAAGVMVALGQMGSVSASVPLNALNNLLGWKATFRIIGLVSVLISLAAVILVDDHMKPGEKAKKKNYDLKQILSAGVLILAVWFFFAGGPRLSYQSLWGKLFYTEALGSSADLASLFLMVWSVGCVFGSLLLGPLADRIGGLRVLVLDTLVLTVLWFALGFLKAGGSALLCGILGFMIGFWGSGGFTVAFSSVKLFVDRDNNGVATGICNFFGFTSSAIFTQINTFVVASVAGTAGHKYSVLLWMFAACALVGFFLVIGLKQAHDKKKA